MGVPAAECLPSPSGPSSWLSCPLARTGFASLESCTPQGTCTCCLPSLYQRPLLTGRRVCLCSPALQAGSLKTLFLSCSTGRAFAGSPNLPLSLISTQPLWRPSSTNLLQAAFSDCPRENWPSRLPGVNAVLKGKEPIAFGEAWVMGRKPSLPQDTGSPPSTGLSSHAPSLAEDLSGGLHKEQKTKVKMEPGIPLNISSRQEPQAS